MSNTTHICPPEGTFYNGRRVDPVEGLVVSKREAEYLEAKGWRPKPVVDAELAARAKAEAEARSARQKKVQAELAKHEARAASPAPRSAVKATEKKED